MTELLIERALPGDALEPIGDGWTLHGLAVPYERDQEVTDDGATFYLERFAAGSYARDVAKGGRWVNLMLGHRGDDGDRYLGRCVGLSESLDYDPGLYIDFRLNREHPRAEEARSGELRGWSVGAKVYRSREDRVSGQRRVIRELAGLNHVAATRLPQYAGAGVLVAREHELITEPAAPVRDRLRAALASLRTGR